MVANDRHGFKPDFVGKSGRRGRSGSRWQAESPRGSRSACLLFGPKVDHDLFTTRGDLVRHA